MAKAVFTTKVTPSYDDIPEVRYHFPKTYLNFARQAVGDWVVYYEPRREGAADSGRGGRQAYFAIARLVKIEPDHKQPDHFYGYVKDYLPFTTPVPFRLEGDYFESRLQKEDGSTNRGAFGRAVRLLAELEYLAIVAAGFREANDLEPGLLRAAGPLAEPESIVRRRVEQIVSRPYRDDVFAQQIRAAYDATCAMTGLRLINGGGRAETEAAHIRPVGDGHDGPDSVRNGIALSRTLHWMFDRGILSVGDDYNVLLARSHVPEAVQRMLRPDLRLAVVPNDPSARPHPQFLRYHREHIFKG